jgi:hypothetical protein
MFEHTPASSGSLNDARAHSGTLVKDVHTPYKRAHSNVARTPDKDVAHFSRLDDTRAHSGTLEHIRAYSGHMNKT